jgi:translation initiation factor IF-3
LQLGVLAMKDALELAQERDLDLVEVAPNSEPPVCRLLDYGKFRYLQTTKERELRKGQKTNSMREVRFRPRIGRHDIEAKERLVQKLLGQGSKVKVSVMFRGREMEHPELAMRLLKGVVETLRENSKLEQAPSMEGRMMSIVLAPATAGIGSSTVKPSDSEGSDSMIEDGQDAEAKNS